MLKKEAEISEVKGIMGRYEGLMERLRVQNERYRTEIGLGRRETEEMRWKIGKLESYIGRLKRTQDDEGLLHK